MMFISLHISISRRFIFILEDSCFAWLKNSLELLFTRKSLEVLFRITKYTIIFKTHKSNAMNFALESESTLGYPQFSSVQFSRSVVSDSLRPHESQHARPPCPSPTLEVHSDSHPSSQWCHPAISSSCRPLLLLPLIPPSNRVFSNESTLCMRWPECWSFSFSIIPSKEIPGLISFRMDWLDLLAVQGTLKSLLQNHSSKASILRCSAFFTVQLSYP